MVIVIVPFIDRDIQRVLNFLVPPSTEEGPKRKLQGVLDMVREKAPKFEDNTALCIISMSRLNMFVIFHASY